ncbi:hypothetical protein IHE45_14G052300 [Dioscorea alata]|uniref:Uncharacterized protein n=1 Tax=Dioscorea alata TaxID=55571 RepID=A0ACB7URY5_DIOAL|nr:hypothetical protein IHE45_14G052300 [Dioscorea alata]
MVHGILQFTPSIAFRYVLHRCESRDIRCRESCDSCVVSFLRAGARRPGGAAARSEGRDILGASRAGCGVMSSRPPPPRRRQRWGRGRTARHAGVWAGRRGARARAPHAHPAPAAPRASACSRVFRVFAAGLDNDPSAGSPTETLLRLLLPLNDKVQWTSRDVAGGETAPVAAIRTLHRTIQSVGATGGVYKGQGRSQRELMTRAY